MRTWRFAYFRKERNNMKKSVIAVILCVSLLASMLVPVAFADTIIEIDTGGLWGDDILGDDDSGDKTPEDNTGDNAGDNTGDNTGDDNITYIPEDNINTGNNNGNNKNEEIQVVPPKEKEEKDDDKTTVLPTTKPGKTEETPKEEVKEEPKVEMVSFNDVNAEDWFFTDVGTLAGMGVINGYPDGSFLPEKNVTRAEFLKLLVTLMAGDQLFDSYEKVFDDVDPKEWYSSYIVSAIVYGIIDAKDYGSTFKPDEPITRREVAKLVVNALQVESGKFRTPYADTADHNITALYGLGLMQGTVDPATGHRYFYPDTQITRAETAAVILRIYKLSEGGNDYVEQFMKDNNMPPLQALYVPVTENDFYNELTNAWDNNQAFVMYNYSFGAGSESMRVVKENLYRGFYLAEMAHPELATGISIDAVVNGKGSESVLEVRFDSEADSAGFDVLMSEKEKASEWADSIVSDLFDGTESARIKADAIHDYVVNSLEYDDSLDAVSYTAYGALTNNKAVCQGYSAVFNLLCKASGVKSLAVANDGHMWNAVLVDGEILFYDTTYDDTGEDSQRYKGVKSHILNGYETHTDYTMPCVEFFI